VLQFLGRTIEAVFDLLKGGMLGDEPAEMQPRLEIAACKPVKLIDKTLKRLDGNFADKIRKEKTDNETDIKEKPQNLRQTDLLSNGLDHSEPHQPVNDTDGEQHDQDACRKNYPRYQQRQSDPSCALLFIHTFFTAL